MDNKKFILLRYFTILIIIFGNTVVNTYDYEFLAIVLILIFIINIQIRYFLFRHKNLPIFISIGFDWVLGSIYYYNYPGLILPYFIMGVVDSFFLLDGYSRYISSIFGLLIFIYMGKELPVGQLISYGIGIITLGLVSSIIREEEYRKIRAEDLYNRLRISEDELRRSNNELEIYASSIRELAVLKERNRISREIHDSVGHSLSTIIIQLGAIEKVAKNDGEAAALMANNLNKFAKKGLDEIRRALKELKPSEFKQYETLLAMETLIKDFTELTNIDVKLGFSKEKWAIDQEMAGVLYRILQESLSNAAKHGKASKINVFIYFSNEELILTIQDNGIGTNKINMGMGLNSIRERVRELEGDISFTSAKNKGFLLRAVFPFNN